MKSTKRARRELAAKKASRKRIFLIIVAAAVALAAASAIIIGAVYSANLETYSDGYATIELRPDGRFTASLYHNENYNGTYVKTADRVEFTYDAVTISTELDGNSLRIPYEWEDGHGHGSLLPKR